MTEAEWLASEDPQPMLAFVRERIGERKARLFACACCRRVWDRLSHERSRRAVEVAERFADGLATPQQRVRRYGMAMGLDWAAQKAPHGAQAAYNCLSPSAREVAIMSAYCIAEREADERPVQATLL